MYILNCYFYYFTINYPEQTGENVHKEIYINTEVLGIVNSEIVKVTDDNVQEEIDINTEVLFATFTISPLAILNTSVLISISFCTFSSVTFTISSLTIRNTSVVISISFCTFSMMK
jgi:hypothetical protein